MHGLINKAVEIFVIETYGADAWLSAMQRAETGVTEFEAMLGYPTEVTERVLDALVDGLGRNRDQLLEDLGTFLVTSRQLPALRRLLRFGGVSYDDFLHSLEELPDRVQLAVDDLRLPDLTLSGGQGGEYRLRCHPGLPGYGHVMIGVLRAMADDYGALAILDYHGEDDGGEAISVIIVQDAFAQGRRFELGVKSA